MTDTTVPSTMWSSVHDAIAFYAETAPDRVALVDPNGLSLTYAELAISVTARAAKLRDIGIESGQRIALVTKNSVDAIVSYLAITIAHVAVPLNPGYRDEEFAFYFEDLGVAALMVHDAPDAVQVAERRGMMVVANAETGHGAKLDVVAPPDADAIAIVLHTSGTTSRPKIVPLTHANLFAACDEMQRTLELTAADRCLNVMATFHVHGLSAVLSSLIAGASVVCPAEFVAPEFFGLVHEFAPTWYTAAPTIHQAVLEWARQQPAADVEHSLRFIRSASSSMPIPLIGEIETALNVPFLEAYGMTETSPMIATNRLPPFERRVGAVGTAAGCDVAIMLDGALLASGEVGEVVVRGRNVMQSYERNAEANAEHFVDGWFRTGDLGMLDDDGYLYITGRLKEIINRGGEKIAPHEVDRALLAHAAVAGAVTFPVPHPKLGEEVAALVVLRNGHVVTERELQDHVAITLADFKVPRHIEFCEELPAESSGKLKRDTLAERLGISELFGTTALSALSEFSLARTPEEEMLAGIWEEVLKLERISIYDDFFSLGGDSILAAQVLTRGNDALGTEFTFLDFFENPTIAQLAERKSQDNPPWLNPPQVEPAPDNAVLPLSIGQEALFVMQLLVPGDASNNVYRAIRMRGVLDHEALIASLSELVQRHDSLRTTYVDINGVPTRVIAPFIRLDVPVTDLASVADEKREALAIALVEREARAPFDLAQGPVLRTRLWRVSETDHILLLTMHHIMMDGWSSGILFSELEVLYSAHAQQRRSPLPMPRLRHADYAYWQRHRLNGQLLEHLNEYWKGQLADVPASTQLPFDHARPSLLKRTGGRIPFRFSTDVLAGIKRVARAENATLYMGLLTVFKMLLLHYSQQTDVVVGSPISGRDRPELESLVGYFSNSLVMRTQLDGDPTVQELIQRVRRTVLDAHAHHELPFANVVAAVGDVRVLNQNPLFQANFRLRNIPLSDPAMIGLDVAALDIHNGMAKFELAFEMWEDGDGLTGFTEFSNELFEPDTIATMVAKFETLLEIVAAQPRATLSDVLTQLGTR